MFISINKIFIFLQSVLKKKSSMDLVILASHQNLQN